MAKEANIEFFIGESIAVTATIVTGSDIVTTAAVLSTATSIAVDPIKEQIENNDILLFPDGVRATLDAQAVVGATSISIDAITGNIQNRAKGQKIQDIALWTNLAARFRHQADDSANIAQFLQGVAITLPGTLGDLTFTITKADTVKFQPGLYVWDLWREESGSESALIYGSVNVLRAPSQAPT